MAVVAAVTSVAATPSAPSGTHAAVITDEDPVEVAAATAAAVAGHGGARTGAGTGAGTTLSTVSLPPLLPPLGQLSAGRQGAGSIAAISFEIREFEP